MGLPLLRVDLWSRVLFMKMALDLMIKFVITHHSLSGSLVTALLVSVSHPRSDSVKLLV
jgi:hypothetical protein